MNNASSNSSDLISYCDSAARTSQEFYAKLSLSEKNSDEWNEFLRSSCNNANNIIQVLAFHEIGMSGDPNWLAPLFKRLQTETFPTNLGAIFIAIGCLGGFKTRDDCSHYFDNTDDNIRSAAMQVIYYLPPEDSIALLLKILNQDPNQDLRMLAAERLAYLGSDAGIELLLDSLDDKLFAQNVRTACALSYLKNSTGLSFLLHLIESHLELSKQDRTTLVFSLLDLFVKVGIEHPPCKSPEELPVEFIFRKASDWIESTLAESK